MIPPTVSGFWLPQDMVFVLFALLMRRDMMSMGTGKMMVLLCSAEILFRVCRYRSCNNRNSWG